MVVYDVSDLGPDDSAFKFLDDATVKEHGRAELSWPYVLAKLDHQGHMAVVERINHLRRARR